MNTTFPYVQTIIFDGDNTLWECGEYYLQQKTIGAGMICTETGMPYDQALALIEQIDLVAIRSNPQNGFDRKRFPTSFAAAALAAFEVMRCETNRVTLAQVCYDVGQAVFDAPYALYEGVRELLTEYRLDHKRLVLYTKGADDIQNAKIDKNGLRHLFDHIWIVPNKNPATLARHCVDALIEPGYAIMVGDSPKDDIGPANELGLRTVQVHNATQGSWHYEDTTVEPTHRLARVTDLPSLVPHGVATP